MILIKSVFKKDKKTAREKFRKKGQKRVHVKNPIQNIFK